MLPFTLSYYAVHKSTYYDEHINVLLETGMYEKYFSKKMIETAVQISLGIRKMSNNFKFHVCHPGRSCQL